MVEFLSDNSKILDGLNRKIKNKNIKITMSIQIKILFKLKICYYLKKI